MFQINELKVMNRGWGEDGVGGRGDGAGGGGGGEFRSRFGCLLSPEDTRLCYPDSLTVVIS